jgi:hypothetical protein
VYALLLAGVLLNGLVIWDNPLERAGALVTAAAIVGMMVNAVRRGAFKPRLAIELCDDRAGGGGRFAIMAGCGRVQGDGATAVEPDDDGERLDLPLPRGQILLPLAAVPRRLDIVPEEPI